MSIARSTRTSIIGIPYFHRSTFPWNNIRALVEGQTSEEAAMTGCFEDAGQRWGVLVGSPNTTVEIEFPRMCPPDVTLHYVRMPTDGNIADNSLFEGVVQRTTAG